MSSLDLNNTPAKACRDCGLFIFAAAMIGEFGCEIGWLTGGNTHDIKNAVIGIGCVALVGALLFFSGYVATYNGSVPLSTLIPAWVAPLHIS